MDIVPPGDIIWLYLAIFLLIFLISERDKKDED